MKVDPETAEEIREALRSRAPLAGGALPDDLPLGPGGLGLDSIALVELLLELEGRFGLGPTADLLQGPPLTVGLLLAHVRAAGR